MSETMRSLMKTAEASNMLAEEATRKVVEVMKENARLRALVAATQEKCAQVADKEKLTGVPPIGSTWSAWELEIVEATVRATSKSIASAIRSLNLTEPPHD